MFALLIIIAASIIPVDPVVRESVDLVEVNHFYDECGRLVFDQSIFWDWHSDRYNVRAWRLIKHESQLPVRDHASGRYVTTWQDGEQVRQVSAASIRETWTQFDPELSEREIYPKENRRELRRVGR